MPCSTYCLSCNGVLQVHFDLVAVNLEQKQPGIPVHVPPDYLSHTIYLRTPLGMG